MTKGQMDALHKRWMLVEAPLRCRREILNEIELRFDAHGRAYTFDTTNSASGVYTVNYLSSDYTRGTIRVNTGRWTNMMNLSDTDEEFQESCAAGGFIHLLLLGAFEFELRGSRLVVIFEDREYMFEEKK